MRAGRASYCGWDDRPCGGIDGARSRGSVFQTGLPLWARIRGVENPRLLRDRPSDGLHLCAKNYAGFMVESLWVHEDLRKA